VIPVVLDLGTDQEKLLEDLQYLDNRHPRVRGERYDALSAPQAVCFVVSQPCSAKRAPAIRFHFRARLANRTAARVPPLA
jgi:hypothetical protein